MDDALKGNKVRLGIQAAVTDALTRVTLIDALGVAFKDQDSYEQHLTASITPVAERIAAEYV